MILRTAVQAVVLDQGLEKGDSCLLSLSRNCKGLWYYSRQLCPSQKARNAKRGRNSVHSSPLFFFSIVLTWTQQLGQYSWGSSLHPSPDTNMKMFMNIVLGISILNTSTSQAMLQHTEGFLTRVSSLSTCSCYPGASMPHFFLFSILSPRNWEWTFFFSPKAHPLADPEKHSCI